MRLKRIGLILLALAGSSAGCGSPAAPPTSTPMEVIATGTASQTPSPVPTIPTPSATLPPAPKVFTEEFNAPPPYWSFLEIDNGQTFAGPSLRDGFLVFDLSAANQWAYALYGGHNYADVTVEAEMQDRTGGDGAAGLLCRYDEKKGWYELNVYADQTYQLLFGEWLAEGVARYTPLYHGASEKIQSDTNEIGLRCQGKALTPFINGVQMRTWQELKFGLQSGKTGLAASSFEDAPLTIAFDWAKVSVP